MQSIRFGNGLVAGQTYLPGTDPSRLPGAPVGVTPVAANALTTASVDPSGAATLFGGRVAVTEGAGAIAFDVVGGYGSVRNAAFTSDEGGSVTFDGFVHVDALFEGDAAVDVSLLGAKRGNVLTGGGGDAVTIELLAADCGDRFRSEFRVGTGDGDDTVTIGGLDRAAEIAAGDTTFAGTLATRFDTTGLRTSTFVDLGEGDDRFDGTGSVTRDRVNGGDGNDVLLGGGGNDVLVGGDASEAGGAGSGSSGSQTDSTSRTLASGERITLSLTAPQEAGGMDATASIRIGRTNAPDQQVNIALVVDTSGSTSAQFRGAPGSTLPGDANGDRLANTVLDAEIVAVSNLLDAIAAAGFGDANVGIVRFDSRGELVASGRADLDSDGDGTSDLQESLATLGDRGSTRYDFGLAETISFLNASPPGANYVWFLSDGSPSANNFADEVATLIAPDGLDATVTSIGVGLGASLPALDRVDDGLLNGSAIRVTDLDQLNTAVLRPPVDATEIERVRIVLNGVEVDTIERSELTSDPLGLSAQVDLTTLGGGDDTVVARLELTGGETVEVDLVIDQPSAPVNDRLVGGAGNDMLTGGGGADVFVFGLADGSDRVTDFDAAVDQVELAGADAGSLGGLGTSTFTFGATSVTATNGHIWTIADFDFV